MILYQGIHTTYQRILQIPSLLDKHLAILTQNMVHFGKKKANAFSCFTEKLKMWTFRNR